MYRYQVLFLMLFSTCLNAQTYVCKGFKFDSDKPVNVISEIRTEGREVQISTPKNTNNGTTFFGNFDGQIAYSDKSTFTNSIYKNALLFAYATWESRAVDIRKDENPIHQILYFDCGMSK